MSLESLPSLRSISVIYSSATDGVDPTAYTPSYCKGTGLQLLDGLDEHDKTDRSYMEKIRHFYYYMPLRFTLDKNQAMGPPPQFSPPPMSPINRSEFIDRRRAVDADWTFYCEHLMLDELKRFENELRRRKHRSIKDHLANLEFELNREVMLRREPIRCWDNVRGGLRLRYQARCFSW